MEAVVIGMGKSGTAAAELLRRKGYRVTPYDDKNPLPLPENPSLAVKSPGVPPNHPVVQKLKNSGVPVIGEVELAYRFSKGRIVAITGTNGKSTTTALIHHVLLTGGYKAFIGGNYGIPFSSFTEETSEDSITVLELSSFQIEDLVDFKCEISVILNITPDHLNRYSSLSDYASAKLKLLSKSELSILNLDDPILGNLKGENFLFFSRKKRADAFLEGDRIVCGEFILPLKELPLKGVHNAENYMASLLVLKELGVPEDVILQGFKTFKGLPHRTEFVATINGVTFINDSKSTNVDSLRKALESFNRIVLIAGGSDKGLDFSPLKSLVEERVKAIVAIGETAPTFKSLFGDLVDVVIEGDIYSAVERAYGLAESGDVVLLSPGCASFDMFKNFEERGEKFKEAVRLLEETLAGR
ncbi:UDP-N-acetylmuramoyl-L-alanine--D-glutamate ligase [Phorcysia thermohydrogeniphila]|uniref:UDP-N-acetylmuramoylalanine--D-glutamate ligase n=1 Tax=Phorcysia thermohydrogeniphila TaxID=936138 RepID=A0A4R1GE02_9BACT|nr:UDP-N-acetylmuramoyl-L-alanine--D-glutamate ligase [Phorcysia thermohydrogeniphila]TCK06374.1 UDP-N-acetylmuramoylalanine--D-glutamate ligase [Phorcysia thermohydrogeniphila]